MSYACDEMGQAFEMPIEIGVDNATAITFASGTVKKSKLRHIDARQDWVQALRDSELVKLVKVPTKDNYADLMTKILEPETFTNLRDGMMVSAAIPETVLERSGPSGYNQLQPGKAKALKGSTRHAPRQSPAVWNRGRLRGGKKKSGDYRKRSRFGYRAGVLVTG